MTASGDIIHGPAADSVSWREATLWVLAGLVAIGAHLGAAAWAIREPPALPASDAPPAAIMVELAPEIVAPEVDEQNIATDREVAQQVKAEELQPVEEELETAEVVQPDPEAAPAVEPERIVAEEPEVAEIEPAEVELPEQATVEDIDPIEEFVTAQIEEVEVPLPTARPPPPERTVEKEAPRAERPRRKPPAKRPAPSRNADIARVQARQAEVAAASQTSSGSGPSISPARWQSRLLAHLERRKRYPSSARSRGEQGTAYVRFRIDDAGNVVSASLARSSGFPALDEEVVAMVRRASPVPAPPPGVNRSITVPVRFSVR